MASFRPGTLSCLLCWRFLNTKLLALQLDFSSHVVSEAFPSHSTMWIFHVVSFNPPRLHRFRRLHHCHCEGVVGIKFMKSVSNCSNSSPTSSFLSFFSYSGSRHQSFIRGNNHFTQPRKDNASTLSRHCEIHTITSSLTSFRLTISTISSSLSYEIVDDIDPYPGYFNVSLFSDLENTEIPS